MFFGSGNPLEQAIAKKLIFIVTVLRKLSLRMETAMIRGPESFPTGLSMWTIIARISARSVHFKSEEISFQAQTILITSTTSRVPGSVDGLTAV